MTDLGELKSFVPFTYSVTPSLASPNEKPIQSLY